jgi:hypothetical protein
VKEGAIETCIAALNCADPAMRHYAGEISTYISKNVPDAIPNMVKKGIVKILTGILTHNPPTNTEFNVSDKEMAAQLLADVSAIGDVCREIINQEGVVKTLVNLTTFGGKMAKPAAVTTLGNLTSINALLVAKEGAIKPLIDLLLSEKPLCILAVTALAQLIKNEEVRVMIGKAGAFNPLAQLVASDYHRDKVVPILLLKTLARQDFGGEVIDALRIYKVDATKVSISL